MKSYSQHLKSTQEFGETHSTIKKPILRSSGIFPVIQNQHYSSSIHFLGYWLLKRNIPEITLGFFMVECVSPNSCVDLRC